MGILIGFDNMPNGDSHFVLAAEVVSVIGCVCVFFFFFGGGAP